MIRAGSDYLYREVAPRWRSIVKSAHFWVGLTGAVVVGRYGEAVLAKGPRVGDSVMIILTYAAIALGFCIAGLTVALSVERGLGLVMATSQLPRSTRSAYSDLVFVFSWTAVVHWMAIVAGISLLIANRDQSFVLDYGASIPRRVIAGSAAFLSVYGICQFLVTLITLSQVAEVYIGKLRELAKSTGTGAAQGGDGVATRPPSE
jgi:hypothetical protein